MVGLGGSDSCDVGVLLDQRRGIGGAGREELLLVRIGYLVEVGNDGGGVKGLSEQVGGDLAGDGELGSLEQLVRGCRSGGRCVVVVLRYGDGVAGEDGVINGSGGVGGRGREGRGAVVQGRLGVGVGAGSGGGGGGAGGGEGGRAGPGVRFGVVGALDQLVAVVWVGWVRCRLRLHGRGRSSQAGARLDIPRAHGGTSGAVDIELAAAGSGIGSGGATSGLALKVKLGSVEWRAQAGTLGAWMRKDGREALRRCRALLCFALPKALLGRDLRRAWHVGQPTHTHTRTHVSLAAALRLPAARLRTLSRPITPALAHGLPRSSSAGIWGEGRASSDSP